MAAANALSSQGLPYDQTSTNAGASKKGQDDAMIAYANWSRYCYVKDRGHDTYCEEAKRLEDMYIGQGKQWLPDDRQYMEEEVGRKCIELNEIAEAINGALGYQVNNRVDIAFKPRGQGATEQIASALSRVSMQIADNVKYPWHETQVFTDGMIQRRGYFELRMAFDDSMNGECALDVLDPLDVIPDPDAKSYDPDKWQDVTITRWLMLDEIESMYGTKARKLIEERNLTSESDFGYDLADVERNKFGDEDRLYDAYMVEGGVLRVRIIDRQHWKMSNTRVVVYPTGDIRVAANASMEKLASLRQQGCVVMLRPTRRVRWTVSACCDVLLHDDWSPYNHFTVIPYFPYFRRGKTKGGVDDLVGPQELLNKALSQFIHIVNSTANSGYTVEQNSLTNMTTEDLEENGAKTGVVLEYRKGANKPEKIQPNSVPSGMNELIGLASEKIRSISGNTDAMRGQGGKQQSGVAVQSQQFAAQMSLTIPLDNLQRTRHMLAGRMLELIQRFYDLPRLWRIEKMQPNGTKTTEELQTNWLDANNQVINNLTVGEYDVVITDQPSQITFENTQFNQAMDMRKIGLMIPDDVVLRYSNLADKSEIIDRMNSQQHSDPVAEAKAAADQARASLSAAQAVAKNVEALFSAIRTAQIITQMPAVAGIADTIVKSAGFVDADQGAVYGQPGQAEAAAASGQVQPPPTNTHPATPDNPERGMDTGIEAGPAASQPA